MHFCSYLHDIGPWSVIDILMNVNTRQSSKVLWVTFIRYVVRQPNYWEDMCLRVSAGFVANVDRVILTGVCIHGRRRLLCAFVADYVDRLHQIRLQHELIMISWYNVINFTRPALTSSCRAQITTHSRSCLSKWTDMYSILLVLSNVYYAEALVVVVRLFVPFRRDNKSRTQEHRKLTIGAKEARDTGDPWPTLEVERWNTCRGGGVMVRHSLCVLQGHSNVRLVYYDVKADSSRWRFMSPLAGGGGILCWLHYRPRILLILI